MKSYIKLECVVCGQRLLNPEENYIVRGNFCPTCTAKAEAHVRYKTRLNAERLAIKRAGFHSE